MGESSSWSLTQSQRSIYCRYAELSLPRHTSYPIAPVWTTAYGPSDFRLDLGRSAAKQGAVSLYVHVPFCQRLCYYCACTKEIVPLERRKVNDPANFFLEGVRQEADRLAFLVAERQVHQVHLGGGSPTFLTAEQLQRLWIILRDRFQIVPEAEIAVEVDPRITSWDQWQLLRGLGFNRISLGIQDFDPNVQKAVNRLQPFDLVQQSVAWCRSLGFSSINFDLIYGLPFQTCQTMADTLEKTIALAPDRIAFFRLAVIPEMFRWQNTFRQTELPSGDLALNLNLLAIQRLLEAGYEFIGLDHFARSEDSLAQAYRAGSLHRNFQGMTTGKTLDLVGLGPSAISMLQDAYAQNRKGVDDWHAAVRQDLATERGRRLDWDDRIRRELLQQLYGYGRVERRSLEKQFGIVFDAYFAPELHRLARLREDGLVEYDGATLRLLVPLGRLLTRVVAAVFDRYLPAEAFFQGLPAQQASKVG